MADPRGKFGRHPIDQVALRNALQQNLVAGGQCGADLQQRPVARGRHAQHAPDRMQRIAIAFAYRPGKLAGGVQRSPSPPNGCTPTTAPIMLRLM